MKCLVGFQESTQKSSLLWQYTLVILCHATPLAFYRTTYKKGNGGSSDHGRGNDDTGEDRQPDQSDVDTSHNNDDKTPDINDAAVPLYVYAFLFKQYFVN